MTILHLLTRLWARRTHRIRRTDAIREMRRLPARARGRVRRPAGQRPVPAHRGPAGPDPGLDLPGRIAGGLYFAPSIRGMGPDREKVFPSRSGEPKACRVTASVGHGLPA